MSGLSFKTRSQLHWQKKWSHFDLKSWVILWTKIGFRVIGEYSQYRVNLTQIFSNYSESRLEFQFRNWLNFLGPNDSIFLSVLTPFSGILTSFSAISPINMILKAVINWRNIISWTSIQSSMTWCCYKRSFILKLCGGSHFACLYSYLMLHLFSKNEYLCRL